MTIAADIARTIQPHAPLSWDGRRGLDWSRAPFVMGIVNVTDDSFSGDGLRGNAAAAIAQARAQVAAGADLIDLGAESTRPGAAPVTAEQEIARLLPVLEGLKDIGVPISVDTRRAAVMRAVARKNGKGAGAQIINDIAALEGEGSLEAARDTGLPVVLMHMQGEPGTMQQAPRYDDVVAEVYAWLEGRIAACLATGIAREKIILDPGIGFGKTAAHNLSLLRAIGRFHALGCPLLVGLSRKSFIGAVMREAGVNEPEPARRLPGSLAAALWAVSQGVQIVRVHDVAETVQALKLWRAITAT